MRGQAEPSRRLVLGALAGLPFLAAAATGCTTPAGPPPPPDPLVDLAVRAQADATAAELIAGSIGELAVVATEVARVRGEHALALQAEVDRASPARSSGVPAPSTSMVAAPADPAAAKTLLLDALADTERRIAEIIATVPRYRAGLLGSVAAGCASMREVLA